MTFAISDANALKAKNFSTTIMNALISTKKTKKKILVSLVLKKYYFVFFFVDR